MFGLTIIKKSKIEKLQTQFVAEKINVSQLTEEIAMYRRENKLLRESNHRLFEKTAAARTRDPKGKFSQIKNNKNVNS